MRLEDKVYTYVCENNMIHENDNIIVGVSGGADSVCLLNILHFISKKIPFSIYAVHINHGIRGKEADDDESYVVKLCDEMGIDIYCEHFDIPALAKINGTSEEEQGRIIRYETFNKIGKIYGSYKIAVAHNANDSVETTLYNMCRGTGIKGVTGISAVRDNIIRPLLCASRDEIEYYLQGKEIAFRTDSTNLSHDYTRNRIRLELIPFLNKNINEKSTEHILSLAEQLKEIQEYMENQVVEAYNQIVKDNGRELVINKHEFFRKPNVIQREIVRKCIEKKAGKLKDVTKTHIDIVIDIIKGESGKRADLPYNLKCQNNYDECKMFVSCSNEMMAMELATINIDMNAEIAVDMPAKYILSDGSQMIFELENNVKFEEKIYTKWFDYDKINNAVQIRKRENGDFFMLKNGGRKKLKDYFIDEKIPREDRDRIPVLANGSHIIWAVGYRISEEHKVTDSTKKVLKVQYIDSSRGGV